MKINVLVLLFSVCGTAVAGTVAQTPEPASLFMVGGAAVVGLWIRHKRKQK